LWPADTFVSFDEGLNTAIRKLRVLFGDSADNPRFIETIPRRGYRFIAPVTEIPLRNVSTGSQVTCLQEINSQTAVAPDVISTVPGSNEHPPTAAASSRPHRRFWIWILSLLL
jgi:DNA-binding winged helix-turn-helix (wHTH) protein